MSLRDMHRLAALLALATLSSGAAGAQEPDAVDPHQQIDVTVDPTSLVLELGHRANVTVLVTNPLDRDIVLVMRASTLDKATSKPGQARVGFSHEQFELAAGASQRVRAVVLAPADANPADEVVSIGASEVPANATAVRNAAGAFGVAQLKLAMTPPRVKDGEIAEPPLAQTPPKQVLQAEPPALDESSGLSWGVALAGAAAAAGGGAVGVVWLRKRWGLLLAPLYTRIARNRVLDQPKRERIAALVQEEPGISFGELQRRLDVGAGTLTHHARMLERAGVLFSSPDGQTRRFFHVGAGRQDAVPPLAERALTTLQADGPMSAADLARRLGVSRQALHYHVKKLVAEGRLTVSGAGRDALLGVPTATEPSAWSEARA